MEKETQNVLMVFIVCLAIVGLFSLVYFEDRFQSEFETCLAYCYDQDNNENQEECRLSCHEHFDECIT